MKPLVDRILSCSTSPKNWGSALDQFNETFDVFASCMFSVHEFREFRMNFEWSEFHREHLPKEVLERLKRGDDKGDAPGYHMLFNSPPQKFYDEMQMFGVDHYHELPPSDIRAVTEGQGIRMRIGAALNQKGPWIDGLFCHHQEEPKWHQFMADQRAEIVLPIMANSVELGRTLQALKSRYSASLSILDSLGLAVFLVDETGCVIETNKEAERILDLSDGLSVTKARRLNLITSDENSALESMVLHANGLLRGEIKRSSNLLAATRPSGEYDYLISVRALTDSQSELEVGLKCAFVTVIDPARKGILSADGVTALAELSPAESGIVDLLVQGFRPNEVAERRDVSLNTVKSQLKAISQKLRCSTQSDIIRTAAATRVPFID